MVVPDLYVFTLKFHSNFSLYKKDKNMKKKNSKKNKKKKKKISKKKKKKKLPLFYATFQCGRYDIFKKKLNFFLTSKK